MKFNSSLSSSLTQSEVEDIVELLNACDEKGVLVKPYFRFPLTQPTGSYYDHNYAYWWTHIKIKINKYCMYLYYKLFFYGLY